ncbi:hypothetical protein ABB30_04915 [Stenotrophomonas ginsengisoli]|uniref:Uncharacterized protein n=1 Tax=Stenotrophomonas ginsengisoli TaxID=336566 RepID=A0A0R0D8N5_9GAMM|nr:hypothetical protein [Stenotrophomonas ginsengisoli]KRG78069.1 hypothetical protein ABB30_04915 [Stenotrophomonas ginsengisoli]
MDKEVERVRPEYLEPIGKKRSGFPLLLLVGIAVAVLAALGLKQHMETQAAWRERFDKAQPKAPPTDPAADEERRVRLAGLQEQRRQAEERYIRDRLDEVVKEEEAGNIKCIQGTAFRRIPGGWENIPNIRCSN